MKVSNESDRPFVAQVNGDWYSIDPGKSIDVDDPAIAANLAEHGATLSRAQLESAMQKWAERNRELNASWSSEPAPNDVAHASVTTPDSTTEPPIVPPADGTYDPAQYGVGDVQEYLLAADDTERARVINVETERGEKARKGIVEWQAPAAVS